MAFILAALLIGIVTVGATLWFLGKRVFSKNRAIPKPLVVRIHGKPYVAHVSNGHMSDKTHPYESKWQFHCPFEMCTVTSLMTEEGFHQHLVAEHGAEVNMVHTIEDRTVDGQEHARWIFRKFLYPIRDRWRKRKWFRGWKFWPHKNEQT